MFSYAAKVDIGVHEEENDDRVLVGKTLLSDGVISGKSSEPYLLAAVCDGVGGLSRGYRAAEITLDVMQYLQRQNVDEKAIRNGIEEANRRVLLSQQEENCTEGMRSTISGFYADGQKLLVFNAGDSRVYRFRYKYLMQVTKDDSLVQDMLELGELTEEEARFDPRRNIINKCIGDSAAVQPKIVDLSDDFSVGDLLLVCSDGISDVLEHQVIQQTLYQHKADPDLSLCCERLISLAIEQGSQDNMSVIVVRKE